MLQSARIWRCVASHAHLAPVPVFPLLDASVLQCVLPAQIGVATGNGVATRRTPASGHEAPGGQLPGRGSEGGLTAVNVSGADKNKQYIVETTGNGVAIFDYDNDGLPDILLVNGDRFQKDGSPQAGRCFIATWADSGLRMSRSKAGLTHAGWGQGVCAGDIDNDGHVDVFITAWGENVLYHNLGDGTFRNETAERGLASSGRRAGARDALLSISTATDFSICWWCITLTSTPRGRRIPVNAPSASGRGCR